MGGLFGLLVAYVTWKLALQREKSKYKRELQAEDYSQKENFYVGCLATINKIILQVKNERDDLAFVNETSLLSAQASILSDEQFKKNLDIVFRKIDEWSYNYKRGLPKKFGETGLVTVSTADQPYIDKAEKLYLELMSQIRELSSVMRDSLKELKTKQEVN